SVRLQFGARSVCGGLGTTHGAPLPVALNASIAAGELLGALNGALVAGMRLRAIVVTLATMVTWREGLRCFRQGEFVNLPEGVQWFGLSQVASQWTLILIALALLVLIALAMRHLAA